LIELQHVSGSFVEVHSYIGDDIGAFNLTLAAYLMGVSKGAYFGAGNTWSTTTKRAAYARPLGAPLGSAQLNGTVYTRAFLRLHLRADVCTTGLAEKTSCIRWSDGARTGNNC
jgi:Hypothetical glycosyl hydrolase family 15